MEHHVLERPRIATERRKKPSVVKLDYERDPDDRVISLRLDIAGLMSSNSDQRISQNRENMASLSRTNDSRKESKGHASDSIGNRRSISPLHKPPSVPERGNLQLQNKAPAKALVAKSSRKWVQVLGIPDRENEALEKQRIRNLAHRRGAKKADVNFMLEQIARLITNDNKLPNPLVRDLEQGLTQT